LTRRWCFHDQKARVALARCRSVGKVMHNPIGSRKLAMCQREAMMTLVTIATGKGQTVKWAGAASRDPETREYMYQVALW
jgi:hypothetical protein